MFSEEMQKHQGSFGFIFLKSILWLLLTFWTYHSGSGAQLSPGICASLIWGPSAALLCWVTEYIYIYIMKYIYWLCTQYGAQHGAWTHNSEIKTWAEIKSQMINWLSHPGVSMRSSLNVTCLLSLEAYRILLVHGILKDHSDEPAVVWVYRMNTDTH